MQQQGAGREGFTQLGERRRYEATGRMISGINEKVWENKEKREGMQQEGEERRCETTWRRGGKSREKGERVKQHGEDAGKVGRREKV